MTMHLEGPWLSMTGKRKGKVKFRNAEEARRARELATEWEQNQAKWRAMSPTVKPKKIEPKVTSSAGFQSRPADENRPRSLNSWVTGPVNTKETPKYTGTKILGIGTMHKSNAVPVFSDEEAKDISKMRRN
jgi:hypothetical protein